MENPTERQREIAHLRAFSELFHIKLSVNTSGGTPATSSKARVAQNRQSPSKLPVPSQFKLFANRFNKPIETGTFIGREDPERPSVAQEKFAQIRRMASEILDTDPALLEPTPAAIEHTQSAVKAFFFHAYQFLKRNPGETFPLADKNKCIGMVAVPGLHHVMIAISQDKDPTKDMILRKNMLTLIDNLNRESKIYQFELVCTPTYAQYFMPRTLQKETNYPAELETISPRSRCVEVALMVALNKIGRHVPITPQNTAVMAFGGTLWAHEKNSVATPFFGNVKRNLTYTSTDPIQIEIEPGCFAFIDIWDPCKEHCAKYRYQMIAIGAAGGPATSFFEPRSETMLCSPCKPSSPTSASESNSPSRLGR